MASDVKWIKISTDIFNDDAFQIIDDLPERDAIELIWFKLLVFAGKQNNHGLFMYKDAMAYTDEMLASIFHRPINTVRLAMETFVNLKMIEVIEDVYSIPNWDKYQNLDALEEKKERDKEYSKKYREKQKLLVENKKSSDSRLTLDDSSYSISYSNSYSFSSNSNISNYLYVLKDYRDKDIIDNDIRLNEIICDWMTYKDEKKPKSTNHYGTEKGINALLNKFISAYREYGIDAVVSVVNDSIANNYIGIVWDKLVKPTKNITKGYDWENI